jgi:hypothetical protein
MDKLKVFYVLSVLAVLVLVTSIIQSLIYRPSSELPENGTIIRHSLTEAGGSSLVELTINNKEGRDINYTIKTSGAFPERNLTIPVRDGHVWEYEWPIEGEKNITILISREGDSTPIENIQYYISKMGG